jgi:methylmalonyl-CoA mutase N-terminal domain/subunit
VTDEAASIEVFRVDPQLEAQQVQRVQQLRQVRDQAQWKAALEAVGHAAKGSDNLVTPIIAAVEAKATVGEIADTLRGVFGEYREVSLD